MSQNAFYLLFVPGLTIAVVGGAFVMSAFAMSQGEFQPETRRGLASLLGVLLLVAITLAATLRLDHIHLPH